MREDNLIIIPLSKAKLCANFYCETIHLRQNCPICNSGEFLFLDSILNDKDKFKMTYKYCPSCNAKYRNTITLNTNGEQKILCPVCGHYIKGE